MIEAVRGEYGFYFRFTLYDDDGSVHSLAGDETVTMRVLQGGNDTGAAIGTASIYDASGGVVQVHIDSDDADTLSSGVYSVQLVIETLASKLITKPIKLRILEGI